MNRRTFVLSSSTSLALLGNRAFAQRRGASNSVLTSELTGGEVDVSESSLDLFNQHIEEADGSEHFHFSTADSGQVDIIFWPQSSGDAGEYMQSQADMFFAISPNAEKLGSDSYDDGGWLAFDFGNVAYYEYQLGAYPGHDLVVMINATPDGFAEALEQAQAIMVDGISPFLFTEESGIVALAAARATASTSSSGRSSRRSSGTDETTTGNSRRSRSSTTATEEAGNSRSSGRTSSSGDPVQMVRDNRNTFIDSYEEFFALLQASTDDSVTDAEFKRMSEEIILLAIGWQSYPDEAADIPFGSEHAELEAAYVYWADLVRELGFTLQAIFTGIGTTEEFLAVYDEWEIADDELLAVLSKFGGRSQQFAGSRNTLEHRLASL